MSKSKKVSGHPVAVAAVESRDRMKRMAEAAGKIDGWKRGADAILAVESVPTIFPILDHVIGVGGFPLSKITVIHGPSHMGKSLLALGLLRSFIEAGHYAALIDAERAITDQFARLVMGEAFDSQCFEVLPTNSYEKVRAGVRAWNDRIVADRKSGRIPGDATGIVVVDSIRKLVPDKLWDKICKEMEDGIDGMRGGAGREKAKFNAAWMDELVPLISDGRTAFVAIAREHVVKGTGMFDRDRVEVGGGDSLKYDPSLTMRVTADEIWRGADKKKRLVGYRHPVNVIKTRFGARTTRAPEAAFHSSNGVESPVGLDRAHDLLELGQELGAVELKGAWYSAHVGGGVMERLGQGIEQAASKLRESPEWMVGLERVLREKF